jgi:hypothetical protein
MNKSSRILIACERSQVVTIAFRKLGFYNTFSCDIEKPYGGHPEWHILGDVLEILDDGWAMMIAHPECKYLCRSGERWMYDARYPSRMNDHLNALRFFKALQDAPIKRIAIENSKPMGRTIRGIGRYHQEIQIWQFGTPQHKGLCLWLKNLPLLIPTHTKDDYDVIHSDVHMEPPGPERSKNRAKTDPNVANAFALQWGDGVEPKYKDGLFAG